MSRRTDVLNKYPAPRVSVVNQSRPQGYRRGPAPYGDGDGDVRTLIYSTPCTRGPLVRRKSIGR